MSIDNNIKIQYNQQIKQSIIQKARRNERYRMPIHVKNYRGWGDIRPYLPLFAGIGVEKLYQFYTHMMWLCSMNTLSNGNPDYKLLAEREQGYETITLYRNSIWDDMLLMLKDPMFRRKLISLLRKFDTNYFKSIPNQVTNHPNYDWWLMNTSHFGFDRLQNLSFVFDIADYVLRRNPEFNQCAYVIDKSLIFFQDGHQEVGPRLKVRDDDYYILTYRLDANYFSSTHNKEYYEKYKFQILHRFKHNFCKCVKVPCIKDLSNKDSNSQCIRYVLDQKKLTHDNLEMYEKEVFQNHLKEITYITVDQETQTD